MGCWLREAARRDLPRRRTPLESAAHDALASRARNRLRGRGAHAPVRGVRRFSASRRNDRGRRPRRRTGRAVGAAATSSKRARSTSDFRIASGRARTRPASMRVRVKTPKARDVNRTFGRRRPVARSQGDAYRQPRPYLRALARSARRLRRSGLLLLRVRRRARSALPCSKPSTGRHRDRAARRRVRRRAPGCRTSRREPGSIVAEPKEAARLGALSYSLAIARRAATLRLNV